MIMGIFNSFQMVEYGWEGWGWEVGFEDGRIASRIK